MKVPFFARRLDRNRVASLSPIQQKVFDDLRRFEEAGVTHCIFSASNDERDTKFEREHEGHHMTIREARQLLLDHSAEMPRSLFRAIVSF